MTDAKSTTTKLVIKVGQIPNEFRRPYYASINGNKLITSTGVTRRFASRESAERAAKVEATQMI